VPLPDRSTMPLRNFGLSFSRRAHAGVTWRPSSEHGPMVAGLLLVLIVLVALCAMLAV
jgi:hypothetical protein